MNNLEKFKGYFSRAKQHPKAAVIAVIWLITFYFQPLIVDYSARVLEKILMNEGLEKYKSPSSPDGIDKHDDDIGAIFVNNQYIVSASDDSFLKVWRKVNGTLAFSLRYHTKAVQAVISYDSRYIISGGNDSLVIIADLEKKEVHKLRGHSASVLALTVKDGKIYSASSDGEIIIWDLLSHEIENRAKVHRKAIYSLSISNGSLLAASEDKSISILERNSLTYSNKLMGHKKSVKSVFSYGSDMLVSSGKDKQLIIWDSHSAEKIFQLALENRASMNELFVYDKKLFVASGQSNEIFIYELNKDYTLRTNPPPQKLIGNSDHESIFVKGKCLYAGTTDGTIEVWNIYENTELLTTISGSDVSKQLLSCN